MNIIGGKIARYFGLRFLSAVVMVFAGIFPVNTDDFEELRECMEKLQLNDASLTFD